MVLVVSDRAVLYALCLLWNKMQSCPAIKQQGDGERERGRATVRASRMSVIKALFLESQLDVCTSRCCLKYNLRCFIFEAVRGRLYNADIVRKEY